VERLPQREFKPMEQCTGGGRFQILAFGANPAAWLLSIMVTAVAAIAALIAFFPLLMR